MGSIICSVLPEFAQSRIMLPVFGGIAGFTKMTLNMFMLANNHVAF